MKIADLMVVGPSWLARNTLATSAVNAPSLCTFSSYKAAVQAIRTARKPTWQDEAGWVLEDEDVFVLELAMERLPNWTPREKSSIQNRFFCENAGGKKWGEAATESASALGLADLI
jgi:hypothetical protein